MLTAALFNEIELTKVSVAQETNKEYAVYVHSGTLFSHKQDHKRFTGKYIKI